MGRVQVSLAASLQLFVFEFFCNINCLLNEIFKLDLFFVMKISIQFSMTNLKFFFCLNHCLIFFLFVTLVHKWFVQICAVGSKLDNFCCFLFQGRVCLFVLFEMASLEEIWARYQFQVIQDIQSGNLEKVKMWFDKPIFGSFYFNVNNKFVKEKDFVFPKWKMIHCPSLETVDPWNIAGHEFWLMHDFPYPMTSLEIACVCEHIEIVQYLISKGAKVCFNFLFQFLARYFWIFLCS